MKNSIILFISFITCLASKGQITINQSDMPNIGDTIRQSSTLMLPTIDYTSTGANYNWDFSDLIWATQKVDTFKSVSSTGSVYNLFFYTLAFPNGATIASTGFELDIDSVVPVTDIYDFYRETSTQFVVLGYGASINGAPLPVKFDNPEILYKFPLVMGNADSSTSSFGQSVPGLGYFGEIRKRKNFVDGWGTLTTPYGTFSTIRVKSEVSYHDTINYQSTGYGFDRFVTEYKWLGDNKGVPLLTITENGLSATATYIDSFRVHTLKAPELNANKDKCDVYPTICSNELNIVFNKLNVENRISIHSIEGRELYNELIPMQVNRVNINLKDFLTTSGVYIVKIYNNKGSQQTKIIYKP